MRSAARSGAQRCAMRLGPLVPRGGMVGTPPPPQAHCPLPRRTLAPCALPGGKGQCALCNVPAGANLWVGFWPSNQFFGEQCPPFAHAPLGHFAFQQPLLSPLRPPPEGAAASAPGATRVPRPLGGIFVVAKGLRGSKEASGLLVRRGRHRHRLKKMLGPPLRGCGKILLLSQVEGTAPAAPSGWCPNMAPRGRAWRRPLGAGPERAPSQGTPETKSKNRFGFKPMSPKGLD